MIAKAKGLEVRLIENLVYLTLEFYLSNYYDLRLISAFGNHVTNFVVIWPDRTRKLTYVLYIVEKTHYFKS